MKIAYLKIRNLDSHERKAVSYWIGGGVMIMVSIITLFFSSFFFFWVQEEKQEVHPPRSNKKEPFSHESLDFLSLSRLFLLDLLIRSLIILLKWLIWESNVLLEAFLLDRGVCSRYWYLSVIISQLLVVTGKS